MPSEEAATMTKDHQLSVVESILAYAKDRSNPVFIRDIDGVARKLQAIIESGKEKLHIISDFDMTISKYWVNGERNVSSHRVLTLSKRVPEEFSQKAEALYEHYYPIEISRTISHAGKVQAMVEWWTKIHEYILELNLTKADLAYMAAEVPIELRAGVEDLVEMCSNKAIPLLVFSAGLGDVIEAILRKEQLLTPNVHVISNHLHFGEDGVADGFEGALIHTFNKNEAAIGPYSETIKERRNVILMGDSLGDLRMGEGLTHDTQLTIGFLNHDQESLLGSYAEAFDVVVLNDAPMNFIGLILAALE